MWRIARRRRMREVEREMEQLKLDIHEEHLQAFRGLYLTLGGRGAPETPPINLNFLTKGGKHLFPPFGFFF